MVWYLGQQYTKSNGGEGFPKYRFGITGLDPKNWHRPETHTQLFTFLR